MDHSTIFMVNRSAGERAIACYRPQWPRNRRDAEYGQDGAAPFNQIGFDARIRENEIVEET
jgi:hypothetical protein